MAKVAGHPWWVHECGFSRQWKELMCSRRLYSCADGRGRGVGSLWDIKDTHSHTCATHTQREREKEESKEN